MLINLVEIHMAVVGHDDDNDNDMDDYAVETDL